MHNVLNNKDFDEMRMILNYFSFPRFVGDDAVLNRKFQTYSNKLKMKNKIKGKKKLFLINFIQ